MLSDALFNLASKPLNSREDRIAVASLYQQYRADRSDFEGALINMAERDITERDSW